ncbi:hypothetical protein HPB47_017877, partial [Ixodes persulcatus]
REALPVSDFEWMTKDEIACLNIDDVPNDAPTGYILEVSDIVKEITWLRQNEQDPEKWEIQGQNRTLTIENASYSNSGVYRCDARNMIRTKQYTAKSREIRLVIKGKPTLRTNIEWTRHSDGSRSAELVCTVDSASSSRTKWLGNDGSPLLQSESIQLSVVGNDHRAKINNASELNYGNYTCVSQNKYGIAMSTVEISGKPILKTTMRWTRGVDGSRMVELVCEVHSPNARRTDWLRSDGSPLVHGEFVHLFVDGNKHTAKLKNVSELDYGNYTCVSQNKYGIGISSVEVSDEYLQISVDKNNHRVKFTNASELNYGNYTCVSQNKYGIALSSVEMSVDEFVTEATNMERDLLARARHYQRHPGVTTLATSGSDLGTTLPAIRDIIREVVQEELKKLLPAAARPASFSIAEVVREEVQRAIQPEAPVVVAATEEPTLTYTAVARRPPPPPRTYVAQPRRQSPAPQHDRRHDDPVQYARPEPRAPRKTDVWRTPDRRPLCFHCGEADHTYRRCPYRRLGLRGFHPNDPRPRYGERPREIDEYLRRPQSPEPASRREFRSPSPRRPASPMHRPR